MDLISVLIPTYNVEDYVEEAILSISNQSYYNIEIIVVDDCSTDSTYNKLLKFKKKDSRLKVYRNLHNLKIADTLNRAFGLSNGKYILRMDGDDISLPQRIFELHRFLTKNPEIDLVGSNTYTIDERGRDIGKNQFPQTEEACYESLRFKMSPVAHIWLAKREVYERLIPYRFPSVEDYDFLLRAKTEGFRFTNLNKFLYKIRIRDGNTISTEGLLQRKASVFAFKQYLLRNKNQPESPEKFHTLNKSFAYNSLNRLHSISNRFIAMAVKENKFWLKIIFALASIVTSPYYQLGYLFNRLKYKRKLAS